MAALLLSAQRGVGHPVVVADDEWLTYEQAAELLGCHPSRLPKLIRRGELPSRKQLTGRQAREGTFRRADVERVAKADARRAAERATRPAPPPSREPVDPRPSTDRVWFTPREAAEQLGLTKSAILIRIRREQLPATWNAGRWWIQPEHLWQIEAARTANKTRKP